MRDFLLSPPAYLGGGMDRDVVLVTGVRYSRTVDGYLFPWKLPIDEAIELRGRILDALKELRGVSLASCLLDEVDRDIMVALGERSLVENDGASGLAGAFAFAHDGQETYNLHEVDHLRIARWVPGSGLRSAFDELRLMETGLDTVLGFAFSTRFGFLTSRLQDAGSGLLLSAQVFLPGILQSGLIERVARGLLESGIEPHLSTGPAPSMSPEAFVWLSLHAHPGDDEDVLVDRFENALRTLAGGERRTRERLFARDRVSLEDTTFRAAAILRVARRLELGECSRLLSAVRVGVSWGLLDAGCSSTGSDPYTWLDTLRLFAHPGHLRLRAAAKGGLPDGQDLNEFRATLVRDTFPHYLID